MAELTQNKNSLDLECDCGLLHKISKTNEGFKVKSYGTKNPEKKEKVEDGTEEKKRETQKTTDDTDDWL